MTPPNLFHLLSKYKQIVDDFQASPPIVDPAPNQFPPKLLTYFASFSHSGGDARGYATTAQPRKPIPVPLKNIKDHSPQTEVSPAPPTTPQITTEKIDLPPSPPKSTDPIYPSKVLRYDCSDLSGFIENSVDVNDLLHGKGGIEWDSSGEVRDDARTAHLAAELLRSGQSRTSVLKKLFLYTYGRWEGERLNWEEAAGWDGEGWEGIFPDWKAWLKSEEDVEREERLRKERDKEDQERLEREREEKEREERERREAQEAAPKPPLDAGPETHVFLPLPTQLPSESHSAFACLSVMWEASRLEKELDIVRSDYLASKKDVAAAERKVKDKKKYLGRLKGRVVDDHVRRGMEEAVERYDEEGKLIDGGGMAEVPVERVKVEVEEPSKEGEGEGVEDENDGIMGFGDIMGALEGEGAGSVGGGERAASASEAQTEEKFTINKATKQVGSTLTPKKWTGATPWSYVKLMNKKALWNHFKKGGNGTVKTASAMVFGSASEMALEVPVTVVTVNDFRDFVSLKFLYETSPSLNPAPLFPPVWVDVWKAWKFAEGKEERERAEKTRADWSWVRERMQEVRGRVKGGVVEEQDEGKERRSKVRRARNGDFKPFSWHYNTAEYKEMRRKREKLPAWRFREEVVGVAMSRAVTMVKGTTGCGKSTQVPHFLLAAGEDTRIVVTQPRRIAAIGVAERIGKEIGCGCGGLVGYRVRGGSKCVDNTRLTFVTTQVLVNEPEWIDEIDFVVVDEVHERNWQTDLLLTLLKRKIREGRWQGRVILMSATVQVEVFKQFFDVDIPSIEIEGRTFPVRGYYLEDVLRGTEERIGEEYWVKPQGDLKGKAAVRMRQGGGSGARWSWITMTRRGLFGTTGTTLLTMGTGRRSEGT